MSRQSADDRSQRGSRAAHSDDRPNESRFAPVSWLLSTVLQLIVAIVGLVVVLFALGQALGMDLLGMAAEALATPAGQWIVIAVVAFIAMGAAMRAIRHTQAR